MFWKKLLKIIHRLLDVVGAHVTKDHPEKEEGVKAAHEILDILAEEDEDDVESTDSQ